MINKASFFAQDAQKSLMENKFKVLLLEAMAFHQNFGRNAANKRFVYWGMRQKITPFKTDDFKTVQLQQKMGGG